MSNQTALSSKGTKISVIIPVFNAEMHLRQCLDSVISQTLSEIEIICINDGSTDLSLSILEEYSERDKRFNIINQENQGAGPSRNKGLQVANGEYLLFLDSDDFFEPLMFEKMYQKAINTGSDIIICKSRFYDEGNSKTGPMPWTLKKEMLPDKEIFSYKDFPKYIFQFCVGWPWDKLYKKSFVLKNNLTFQSLRHSNDTLFVLSSLVKAERISFVDDELAIYRMNNQTSLANTKEKVPDCFYFALKALRQELVNINKYKEVEQSFVNYVLAFSLWHYNSMKSENARKKTYNLMHKCFKEFGLKSNKFDANYFYDSFAYIRTCKNLYYKAIFILRLMVKWK